VGSSLDDGRVAPRVPVPGRGVTIVDIATGKDSAPLRPRQSGCSAEDQRRDDGQPVRLPDHRHSRGVPERLSARRRKKIFVGDADGTIWRIDVHDTNPANWKVHSLPRTSWPRRRSTPSLPRRVSPSKFRLLLSLDPVGAVVVHGATGDQENLVASNDTNYLLAIKEGLALSSTEPGRAEIQWYLPMPTAVDNAPGAPGSSGRRRDRARWVVFDRTLYFATYDPMVPRRGVVRKTMVRPTSGVWTTSTHRAVRSPRLPAASGAGVKSGKSTTSPELAK